MLTNIKWVTATTVYPFPGPIYQYSLHMEAVAVKADVFMKRLTRQRTGPLRLAQSLSREEVILDLNATSRRRHRHCTISGDHRVWQCYIA